MFGILNFFIFILGAVVIGFIIFLIIKQIQFTILAIPLYREMVSNQQIMVIQLGKIKDEIETLRFTTINLKETPIETQIKPESKGDISLKEIKL